MVPAAEAAPALLLAVLLVASAVSAHWPISESSSGIPGEELTGTLKCNDDQFACADALRCVPAAWRCDGRAHCTDASDEISCTYNTTCGPGQFRCVRSGLCIAASWRCDGDADCGPHDASDEDPYMCEKDFKCWGAWARCATPEDGQFSCVPVYNFCDGVRHCLDGSDEWDICDNFTESSCAALGCAACRPTHEGASCYCQPGYEWRDGRCVDSDECEWEGACAQRCSNLPGSYACACAAGYVLRADQRSCAAVNDPVGAPLSLIVATESGVERVWPAEPAASARGNHSLAALDVRAIDFLYTNRSVCYVHRNVSRAALVCVDADDFSRRRELPAPHPLPDLDSVEHLAIDWVSGNWYVADSARELVALCDAALRHCRLLPERALGRLRSLALDPTAGYMFWSAWGAEPPAVRRASLAGADARALADLKLVYPGALALDPAARALYWVDAYLECVERVDYDGRRRATVRRGYDSQRLERISVLEGLLYLPVWQNRSVLAASRYRRARAPPAHHAVRARPLAALVYHRQRQPNVTHPCAVRKGGCAHVCVPAYSGAAPRAHCVCRNGYRLVGHGDCEQRRTWCWKVYEYVAWAPAGVEAESYLVVSRGAPALVGGLVLAGAGPGAAPGAEPDEPFAPATHAARPTASDVDIDKQMLYYCDVHKYQIIRQKLDGSQQEVFLGAEVDNCEGLAIDWMSRNVYWTDDALGQLSVARLDARARRVLLRAPHYHPRALALDPANGQVLHCTIILYYFYIMLF
ncbi:unnamed protein product, partial [Brenthis ino]